MLEWAARVLIERLACDRIVYATGHLAEQVEAFVVARMASAWRMGLSATEEDKYGRTPLSGGQSRGCRILLFTRMGILLLG